MGEAGKLARLAVQAVPNAQKDEVVGWHGDALKVKVQAVPEDGKANKALVKFLAKELGVPKASVSLVSGAKSRAKVFEVQGLGREDMEKRLNLA
jgi:uncharacterized protein (TIGR00251 family)